MTQSELLARVEELLAETKAGVLASIDSDSMPFMRWMTPCTINSRPGCLFAVTSANSAKVEQIITHPQVMWMIQSRSLDRIITLRGKIIIIESASLKMEVFHEMGNRLRMFWQTNVNPDDCVVLETIIENGTYFEPMKGLKETVNFELNEGGAYGR